MDAFAKRNVTLGHTRYIELIGSFPNTHIDADCLNRVAGIVMRDVQRATAGASTSTAPAGRSGGAWVCVVQALPGCGERC